MGTMVFRESLPRIYEFIDNCKDPLSPNNYFRNFEDTLATNKTPFPYFQYWEEVLQTLDVKSWKILKAKAIKYVAVKDPKRQDWHQLFDALVEARAYKYLYDEGYFNIRFVSIQKDLKTPDLEAFAGSSRVLCEVKNINRSDKAIGVQHKSLSIVNVEITLNQRFFDRFESHITKARCQLKTVDPNNEALHIVFINIAFDDPIGYCQENYYNQIDKYLASKPHPDIKLVFYNDRNLFVGRHFVMKEATLINPPCV
jgi:hypothetical protein